MVIVRVRSGWVMICHERGITMVRHVGVDIGRGGEDCLWTVR